MADGIQNSQPRLRGGRRPMELSREFVDLFNGINDLRGKTDLFCVGPGSLHQAEQSAGLAVAGGGSTRARLVLALRGEDHP
ncbi:hypothetical protein OH805_16200 [Streptomyces sp. NBC_00879]|uniref:hypothetical protein n=1 Tax=Streptomyces sp. NBC_00879 TaxID=2975855 RepID=UPI0038643A37|nr:hypothetical protein OH805_16200 [Streptomyces sp. NBC_00879]